jgi:hypothetical protein
MLVLKTGSSGLHYAENSFWKMLWTCHKIDYKIKECEFVKNKPELPNSFIFISNTAAAAGGVTVNQ